LLDVLVLRTLVSTSEKNNDRVVFANEINAVARTMVNTKLRDASPCVRKEVRSV
jgi:hypothetical protein